MSSTVPQPGKSIASSGLGDRSASVEFVEKIPIGFARRHLLLGLAAEGSYLPVAAVEPINLEMLQVIARVLRRPVQAVIAGEAEIKSAITSAYQQRNGQALAVIQKMERADVLSELAHLSDREDLLDADSRAPVIKLVNLILFEAVKARASDVHVQPYEQTLVIRLRIDGILYDSFNVPKNLQDEVVGRIKVMGRMNIAERRLPQDGRASVQVGDKTIDLRISSLPTRFGERVVIRLLDKSHRSFSLSDLGMDTQTLEPFRRLITAEHGIILVTGPTGSGKTTTLYSALAVLNARERNILTLEDPIEYGLDGISQTQVSDKKGMTFASGLRTVLRQDPDVIMVGEIRDQETAIMAIQSALTGHLVFSTLHTNDAATAITRLLDLGIEPFLISSSVIGVLAQRLVRRVCPQCGTPVKPTSDQLARVGLKIDADLSGLRAGTGCEFCRGSGYSGRVGIFELLRVTEPVRRSISSGVSASQIAASAVDSGMRTLYDDGISQALAGMTTLEEVIRVTMSQDAK